ncbi:MAG: hypothetical protein WCK86_09510 [Planctomycetia bacterium]
MMNRKAGDTLGKSDLVVKLAVMLFPFAGEGVRRGMIVRAFEWGLLGTLLCIGNRVVDQFLIAQGNDLGQTVDHPNDSRDYQTTEP